MHERNISINHSNHGRQRKLGQWWGRRPAPLLLLLLLSTGRRPRRRYSICRRGSYAICHRLRWGHAVCHGGGRGARISILGRGARISILGSLPPPVELASIYSCRRRSRNLPIGSGLVHRGGGLSLLLLLLGLCLVGSAAGGIRGRGRRREGGGEGRGGEGNRGSGSHHAGSHLRGLIHPVLGNLGSPAQSQLVKKSGFRV